MSREHLLILEEVEVSIQGNEIIKNINMTLNKGEICALVGHNGAGKSVTMKTIMGIQEKGSGHISLHSIDLDDDYISYKSQFSYIPEEPILFTELNVYQHFQLYGTSYQVPKQTFDERVEYFVKGFELEGKLQDFPDDLSKGMRQKVNIISNLITDAPLLIIDEPFIGLDEHAAAFLEKEIVKKAEAGAAVLLTSHVLERVKKFCHTFVMLKNGQIIHKGDIDQLKQTERRITT
jgi:ABC-2 type transport system ATP-binding protein